MTKELMESKDGAQAPAVGCCGPAEQAACCEPAAKTACCGEDGEGCGCR